MSEHPVFVPCGDEHLAAVITVPDGVEARGLVVLLTGASAARSHRFQLWTRTARRLAEEHALASVRFDYRGTGDSSGSLREWRIANPPIDQVLAVARFAQRAVGVDRVAVAGNCLGARLALMMAAQMPECIGAFCMRTPLLEPSRLNDSLDRVRRGKVWSWVRSVRPLHRALAAPLARRKKRSGTGVRGSMTRALARGRLLFLYCRDDFTFSDRVEEELEQIVASLPESARRNYELRVIPGRGLKGFESFAIQQTAIDMLVDWVPQLFDAPAPAERAPTRS